MQSHVVVLSLAFFRMVVIIRECSVHVGNVDIVAVRDRPGVETSVFDLRFDEQDGDPPSFEVGARRVVLARFAPSPDS